MKLTLKRPTSGLFAVRAFQKLCPAWQKMQINFSVQCFSTIQQTIHALISFEQQTMECSHTHPS